MYLYASSYLNETVTYKILGYVTDAWYDIKSLEILYSTYSIGEVLMNIGI